MLSFNNLYKNGVLRLIMKLTLSIILTTAAAFVAQIVLGGFTEILSLTPEIFYSGAYWQVITYMFMHADITHIGLNMFFLLLFGSVVEREIGPIKYALLYFISGVGSALLYLFLLPAQDVLLLGASGAVFGAMTAYAIRFPKNWIFIPPGLPVPALLAIVLIAIFEIFSGFLGLAPGIANFGHVGGIIAGAIFMGILRISQDGKRPAKDIEFVWE
jgi:membrane associated rhomboid family serine protease